MIALGTRVKVNEVAYIVRKQNNRWYAPVKGNFAVPAFLLGDQDEIRMLPSEDVGRWLHDVTPDTNKGVIAFAAKASGVVVGLETKQYGRSTGASGDSFGDDWELGYFEARGRVDLYVVRSELRGKPYYVPKTAVEVIS